MIGTRRSPDFVEEPGTFVNNFSEKRVSYAANLFAVSASVFALPLRHCLRVGWGKGTIRRAMKPPAQLRQTPSASSFSREREALCGRLLADWFSVHARRLPWREDYDPYKVLVSEFMLQQTQVETVLPYFERWMAAYPDLASLARADERDVLKLWEGLGYYSRCRNLLRSARAMAEEGLSLPPSDAKRLRSYPGIGDYTAGAVASVAYNQPVPAVDGNAERVLARLCDIALPAGSGALKRRVREIVARMIPEGRARELNQGLMDLGAIVCRPRIAECPACPWSSQCLAAGRGAPLGRPLSKPRADIRRIEAWGVLGLNRGACLLRRRPDGGLWASMWELPWFERASEDFEADFREWGHPWEISCSSYQAVGQVSFSFTSHRVRARVVSCEVAVPPSLLEGGMWRFVPFGELSDLVLPAPSHKFRTALLENAPLFLQG